MGENGDVKNGHRSNAVNWNKFGLSANTPHSSSTINGSSNGSAFPDTKEQVKELFEHEQEVCINFIARGGGSIKSICFFL